MASFDLPEPTSKNQRIANWVSFGLIASMMVCFSISLDQLLGWFTSGNPNFIWGYLPILVFISSLGAIFARSITSELEGLEKYLYILAEWVVMIVLTKFFYYLVRGFNTFLTSLVTWETFLLTFFQSETAFVIIIVAFVWLFSRSLAGNIEALNVDTTDTAFDLGKLQNSRKSIRSELVSHILWLGILMVVITSLVRYAIQYFDPTADLRWPVANVVLYFLLAFALISQTQFALLRTRWYWHHMPVPVILARRWIRFSLLFFAVLALIAFFLPTGYSMGLLATLNYMLGVIVTVVTTAVQLIFLPIIWLLSLVGCSVQSSQPPGASPTATPPPLPANPHSALPWLDILESVLFWALLVGVVGYSFILLVRQNSRFVTFFNHLKLVAWLHSFISSIQKWFQRNRLEIHSIWGQIQKRILLARAPQATRQARQWLNFRFMSPRQQIIFYYLQLLQRGERLGLKRQISETPDHYAEKLKDDIPDVEEDINGITEKFLEARYSRHTIGRDHSNLVQRFWRNITHALGRQSHSL